MVANRYLDQMWPHFELAFALDRVKALAPKHPEWKETQPFKTVIEDDIKTGLASASGR